MKPGFFTVWLRWSVKTVMDLAYRLLTSRYKYGSRGVSLWYKVCQLMILRVGSTSVSPSLTGKLGLITRLALPIIVLTRVDLLDLLKRLEAKTLEYKRDLSSPDGPLKTIVHLPTLPAAPC